jgi:hypothetical protein
MVRARNNLLGVWVLVLGLLFVWMMSAKLHPEALDVRQTIDNNIGRGCKPGLHYSPKKGMLLILAQMAEGKSGGQIWKFTEQRWGELIPSDKIYESTCFAADDGYWSRVLGRDGYLLLSEAKWIVGGGLFIALNVLCAILRQRGRDKLADEIENA